MLNFQIGKKYRRRNGVISTVVRINDYPDCSIINFEDDTDPVFKHNGQVWNSKIDHNDIIEEVKGNEMKIEVGKWYKTRGGAKVFVGMYVPNGKNKPYVGYQVIENDVYFCDMCWFEDGTFTTHTPMHAADIIEEWKEPKSGVGYVNVYGTGFGQVHTGRSRADKFVDRERLACVRVEWKEGQFDE